MLGTERQNFMKNLKSFCTRLSETVARKLRGLVGLAGVAGACAGLALASMPMSAHAGYDDLTTSLVAGTNSVLAASTNVYRHTADIMRVTGGRYVANSAQYVCMSSNTANLTFKYDLGVTVRGSNYWTTNAITWPTLANSTTNVSYSTNLDLGGYTLIRLGQVENPGNGNVTNLFNGGNTKDGI